MENQEKTEEAIKNGESRENQRSNQEWTIKRKSKRQSRMDNQEKTEETIKNGQEKTEEAIKYGQSRELQYCVYKRKKEKTHNTRCVGHHYVEANTNIVNKI
jgi:hypothetical protein